ncbi:MAG: peptidase M4 [Thermodesulfovibrio sp. RBG_19FT_COMBO_42_12]|nr:MAG: peptidase M4 [Thermodesulfovibrio sp. RBG_19FT_COMBO_42_12]
MDICFIIPPHMLKEIAMRGSSQQKRCAWESLTMSEQMRGQRLSLSVISAIGSTATGTRRRTVYDAGHGYTLPGRLVKSEGSAKSRDRTVNEAYAGAGVTYDLFKKIFGRNSIDDRGMRLDSTVHYGKDYDNAFWNGQQMVYGDGDGELFNRFTIAIDVIGHELTHGVTQYEAGLEYQGQPGALNESMSDVFGSLVKQYRRRQEAKDADWMIGTGLFTKNVNGTGIRSMKEPGTAYDDPVLGRDPQPGHMKDYVKTREDNGGVHINSGIPNRAFYEIAVRLGGHSWVKAGWIWYVTLRDRLRPGSDFKDAASLTTAVAGELYGSGSLEQKAVKEGWAEVGI